MREGVQVSVIEVEGAVCDRYLNLGGWGQEPRIKNPERKPSAPGDMFLIRRGARSPAQCHFCHPSKHFTSDHALRSHSCSSSVLQNI